MLCREYKFFNKMVKSFLRFDVHRFTKKWASNIPRMLFSIDLWEYKNPMHGFD